MHMQKLAEIKGLSDAKVEKLLDAARKLCASYGWQTAKIMELQVCSILTHHEIICMISVLSYRIVGKQQDLHLRLKHARHLIGSSTCGSLLYTACC